MEDTYTFPEGGDAAGSEPESADGSRHDAADFEAEVNAKLDAILAMLGKEG